jgi:MoaA/NifB/PqqE/SkfB family radical SAM enzyme
MKIIPNIPKKIDNFPRISEDIIPYWGFFSQQELSENKGKLLMLDFDFGRYCSLDCPECFRKDSVVDDFSDEDLTYDEIINVIDEARELGLQSVKICGAGEPTENTKFLQLIRDMTDRDIGLAVFTKGSVLGSDEKTSLFNKKYGITTAKELCEQLYDLKVSFMLGFQSFYTEIQDEIVGGVEGHALVRNKALENLVNAGFNNTYPTRLAICSNAISKMNYEEVFEIYVYARERNLYPVTTVTMVSGKQLDKEYLEKTDITDQQKIDLWTKIYSWNIENGIQKLSQIQGEGVSVLPGTHPCNQIACGLYVTANGNVVGCPGFTDVEGNVKETSIKEIWENSKNIRRAGTFNCKCPPKDGITIPNDLYEKVLKNLEEKYS